MLRKKSVSLFMALCLWLSCTAFSAAPFSPLPSNTPPEFISFIAPFYSQLNGYEILDVNGLVINDQFIMDTHHLYSLSNWDELYQYCVNNSITIKKETIQSIPTMRSTELTKNVTQEYYHSAVPRIDGTPGTEKNTVDVIYKLSAYIYYDSVTYKIVKASPLSVGAMNISPGGQNSYAYNESISAPTIASNQYSASYQHSFNVRWASTGNWCLYKRITNSLTVYSD